MDKVTLYSTGCAKCNILRKKLDAKGIQYEYVEGEEAIRALGYTEAPLLKVNDEVLTFVQAVKYVNEVK